MNQASMIRGWLGVLLVFALGTLCPAQKPAGKPLMAAGEHPTTLTTELIAEMVKGQQELLAAAPTPTIQTTLAKMRAACDWQLDHLYYYKDRKTGKPVKGRNSDTDWVRGAFFTGVMGAYYTTTDYRYYLAARKISENNQWQAGPRPRHADDRTICQTYLELYMLEGKKDPKMIESVKAKYDAMMASEQPGRVDWWWCDALYMDPPTLTRLAAATGETKYLDYMSKMYWDATDFLYNKDEHLYFRDKGYFNKTEKNGKKVFWSRGNGWVFGGLCRVLDVMPKDYTDRAKFEQLFKEMAPAVAKAQGKDGLWHSSLLDPVTYPLGETSGSGFFTYGLAWGINNGLLDRDQYLPAAEKGWKALMACVDDQTGKLQYVQFIGADPQLIKKDDNMEYGTGSFLLAGGQMLKLMAGEPKGTAGIKVSNPLDQARSGETVEVEWKALAKKVKGLLPSRVRVMDDSGKFILTQVTYDQNGPQSLIFQADFAAKGSRSFDLTLSDEPLKSVPASKVYCRYVPERFDDFAWENDRIAHRVYGTALQTRELAGKEYMISSGIDVWVKRVRYPVIDKWYASGKYHSDSGEGYDNYTVDVTRGAGGSGIWADEKLFSSENYDKTKWRVLANGPLRLTFELGYNPWDAAGRKFSEVKRVSLDAGSNLSLIEEFLTSDSSEPVKLGLGLTESRGEGKLLKDKKHGVMSYWADPNPKGGDSIATAVIVNPNQIVDFTYRRADFAFHKGPKFSENLMIIKADTSLPVAYYAGAGWSKSGDFADAAAWEQYLLDFSERLAQPLKVALK